MDQTAWALLAIRTRARRAEFARLFRRPAGAHDRVVARRTRRPRRWYLLYAAAEGRPMDGGRGAPAPRPRRGPPPPRPRQARPRRAARAARARPAARRRPQSPATAAPARLPVRLPAPFYCPARGHVGEHAPGARPPRRIPSRAPSALPPRRRRRFTRSPRGRRTP